MVEANLSDPSIQDAVAPGGPGLHIVTSQEGLPLDAQLREAERWIGMASLASGVLNQLPKPVVEKALNHEEVTDGQRTAVVRILRNGITETSLTELRLGLPVEEPQADEPAETTSEPSVQRNERVLDRKFTPTERERLEEILASHRAEIAARAGHMAAAAA